MTWKKNLNIIVKPAISRGKMLPLEEVIETKNNECTVAAETASAPFMTEHAHFADMTRKGALVSSFRSGPVAGD